MINPSLDLSEILSSDQKHYIQLMREKLQEQNKIILDLTWEIDILREKTCNDERTKFYEEIRKEWI
jgi:hypothetical protein